MQRGYPKISVAPVAEPITLAVAKAWLKVDYDDDDDIITELIVAAREYAEKRTNRALMQQTILMQLPCFPYVDRRNPLGFIKLFRSPVQSLKKIQYYNTDNVLTTLYDADADPAVTDSAYLDNVYEPARITAAVNTSWPNTAARHDAVKITFVAGYSSASDIPSGIKLAMRQLLADWYRNRENPVKEKHTAADLMLEKYKVEEI